MKKPGKTEGGKVRAMESSREDLQVRRGSRTEEASGGADEYEVDNQEVVLLAVTGRSPAVLTETIWALAHPADG